MLLLFPGLLLFSQFVLASSHREAPLISNDPLADNTDLYAFRSPDDPTTVTIIANYIPFQLPEGGPNYYTFGTDIRYEIHIKNRTTTAGDDITYRFTFSQVNQDPTTFFNIRLGQQNIKTNYVCEKSTNGGTSFTTIVANGTVPPANIGPVPFKMQRLDLAQRIIIHLYKMQLQPRPPRKKYIAAPPMILFLWTWPGHLMLVISGPKEILPILPKMDWQDIMYTASR
jgi:hypothetical protein